MVTMSSQPTAVDNPPNGELAQLVADRKGVGFKLLMDQLWPVCVQSVRTSRAMRSFRTGSDHVNEVALRVFARLQRDEAHALQLYVTWQQKHPDKTFEDWFRIVIANVIRDYVRENRQPVGAHSEFPDLKAALNELAGALPLDDLGHRPPYTAAQTARQIMELAKQRLSVTQYEALTRWMQGSSFSDISNSLALPSPDEARKAIRAALASLRRQVKDSTQDEHDAGEDPVV